MDKISEDFYVVYFWGKSDLLEEKEHNDNNSLLAGRYVWRVTQPYIYISYTSPLSRASNTDSSGLINDIVASSSLDFFDEALGAVTCLT